MPRGICYKRGISATTVEEEVVSSFKKRRTMSHPRFSSAEIVQRGQDLYDQGLRTQVEARHQGQCLVCDIETGDYEIDADDVSAVQRAKTQHPDTAFYIVRIGSPTAYR